MDRKNFAFSKTNYIICIVSFVIIIIGFFLMTGPASSIDGGFQPDIFSTRRIVIAPMTSFFGFLLMIVGIVCKDKTDNEVSNTVEELNNKK